MHTNVYSTLLSCAELINDDNYLIIGKINYVIYAISTLSVHQQLHIVHLLLFVWNTLTVLITIALRRNPLRVDVAGLQGMQ